MEIAYIGFIYKNDKLFNFFDTFSEELTASEWLFETMQMSLFAGLYRGD